MKWLSMREGSRIQLSLAYLQKWVWIVTALWVIEITFILPEMEAGTQCCSKVNCLHVGTLLSFRLSPAVRPNLYFDARQVAIKTAADMSLPFERRCVESRDAEKKKTNQGGK